MDHAVPISRVVLGEHRLGNLVPACDPCNSLKGQKRFDDFLKSRPDLVDAQARIDAIAAHMRRHGHTSLTTRLDAERADSARVVIQEARVQVVAVAGKAIADINALIGWGESTADGSRRK